MRYPLFLLLFCLALGLLNAQDARLAQQYFQNGEYEKAAELYDALYQKNGNNDFFFDQYFECLLAMEAYSEAESVLQKQIRRDDGNVRLYVAYGTLLERLNRYDDATTQYNKAIAQMPGDQYSVSRLANAFTKQTKYEMAIAVYEKGGELLKDKRIFAYNLGDLYRRLGRTPQMIDAYLNSVEENPERVNQLKIIFQRNLAEEEYRELQTQLYERIQNDGSNPAYPEFLSWVFIQRKDYRNALRQVRALDKRFNENGLRVYELGIIAMEDKDYDAAIQAFDYIVDEKGRVSTLYLDAKQQALRARRLKLVEGYAYSMDELTVLETLYKSFLDEFGYNKSTAAIVLELGELQGLYMNQLVPAITLLTEMVDYPGIHPSTQAEGKLALADFNLMNGDIWEATLLYSQVDKAFKEDILGHEARFRNAKLAYYNGDFEWAQAQFTVLKASTSKLIANDALDISVFIMDNMGLDTSTVALQMYADAELLVFRNEFEAAFAKVDSLLDLFPGHSLEDDVLYLKAQVFAKKRDYEAAATLYAQVVEKFPEDIRADNALFALATLQEKFLDDKEKAQQLYENLFIDYSNSTFAVEARKRYRLLRGDSI